MRQTIKRGIPFEVSYQRKSIMCLNLSAIDKIVSDVERANPGPSTRCPYLPHTNVEPPTPVLEEVEDDEPLSEGEELESFHQVCNLMLEHA